MLFRVGLILAVIISFNAFHYWNLSQYDKAFKQFYQIREVLKKIESISSYNLKYIETQQLEPSIQQAQVNNQKNTLLSTTSILLSFILLYLVYNSIKGELAARLQVEFIQQKLNAETLKTLQTEQKINSLKSRIITVISHEYRTPLTTILSSAELLEHHSHKLSEDRKIIHIQRIQLAVNHLMELFEEVVNLNEAEAEELEFNPCVLELEVFCRQLVQELQTKIGQEHPINFVSLGNCFSCVMDEKLLRQIFTHLLLNAIKYSPIGCTVCFTLRPQGDKVVFQVQDKGIGIPAADQAQLFKPFERGSNVGTISGIGVGLAIVKKLVDLHSGQITVNSVVGGGTTITVTLPRNSSIPAMHAVSIDVSPV